MVCNRCGATATTPAPTCANCGNPLTGPQFPPQAYLPPPADAGPPSEAAYGSVPPPSDPFWTQAPAPPQTPYAYAYEYTPVRRPSMGFSIAGIVLGCLALLILPILLGPLAIIMAGVGKAKGERISTVALVVAVAGTAGGLIFSAVVYRMMM
jgi:hypothetical protein